MIRRKLRNNLFRYSLVKRLTVYFIAFGLILGAFLYWMSESISVHTSINMLQTLTAKNLFRDIFNDNRPDLLLQLTRNKDPVHARKLQNNIEFLNNLEIIDSVDLYVFNSFYSSWIRIYTDSAGRLQTAMVLPDRKIGALVNEYQKSKNKNKTFYPTIFLIENSGYFFVMNLTRPGDVHQYFLINEIQRSSVTQFFNSHFHQMLLVILSLIVISTILGKIFSGKVVGPIRIISLRADEIASGDYRTRLNITRSDEIGMLASAMDRMADKVESDIREIGRNYDTMQTMNQIDKAVLSSISRNDLLSRVVGIVGNLFPGVEIAMLINNKEKSGFDILSFSDRVQSGLFFAKPCACYDEFHSLLLNKLDTLFQMSRKNGAIEIFLSIEKMAGKPVGSFLNIPIYLSDSYFGSLWLMKASPDGFESHEADEARMLADQVGVAFQSVRAFEEKESLLFGIMVALTKSIDAKSKWTAGHSERVAIYAEEIGLKMGFSENEIRKLTISAVLHDIGKIAVPEAILDKPSALTDEEFAAIKLHPEIGAKIVSDIPSYSEIQPGILYHHEHWDGSGYPESLSGSSIPLNSRIITLADVFDAVTEDRPYRKGMSYDTAINFIRSQRSLLFDPEIADLFLHDSGNLIYLKQNRYNL